MLGLIDCRYWARWFCVNSIAMALALPCSAEVARPGRELAQADKQRQSDEPPKSVSSASKVDDAGFGDVPAAAAPPPLSNFSVGGFLRSDWALWMQRLKKNPFAKGRQSLDLTVRYKKGPFRVALSGHGEYDFSYLMKRDSYDRPTLDAYEWQLLPREALVGLSIGHFELTAGYQIVPWGHADLLSVLDVVNPRDLREPGLAELDDIRLPVLSGRFGLFVGNHRIEAMAIFLPAYGLRPPPASPFSSLPQLYTQNSPFLTTVDARSMLSGTSYHDTNPDFAQQFFLRWVYTGPRIDLALYAASILDQRGVMHLPAIVGEMSDSIELEHRRFSLFGFSGALPIRSFLLKWELNAELERPFNTRVLDIPPAKIDIAIAHLANTMLGLSYRGIRNLTINLEVTKAFLFRELSNPLFPPDRPFFAMRVMYSLLRERLRLSVLGTVMGLRAELGWFLRGDISYEIRDTLKFSLGYVTYHPGSENGPITGFDTHDRLYLGLRWDFTLL